MVWAVNHSSFCSQTDLGKERGVQFIREIHSVLIQETGSGKTAPRQSTNSPVPQRTSLKPPTLTIIIFTIILIKSIQFNTTPNLHITNTIYVILLITYTSQMMAEIGTKQRIITSTCSRIFSWTNS